TGLLGLLPPTARPQCDFGGRPGPAARAGAGGLNLGTGAAGGQRAGGRRSIAAAEWAGPVSVPARVAGSYLTPVGHSASLLAGRAGIATRQRRKRRAAEQRTEVGDLPPAQAGHGPAELD